MSEHSHILLIDLDNCPNQLEQLVQNLEIFARIIVCYGSQPPKISLSLARSLAESICHNRLEFIGMQKNGKNAADFGLCFYAGRLSAQMPTESTEYVIVSNDTDLDHAVYLLQQQGCQAKRIGNTKSNNTESTIITETPAESTPQPVATIAEAYYAKKAKNVKARPGKKSTLLNDIKSFCRVQYPDREQEVFNFLQRKGYFSIVGEKVVYDAEKSKQFETTQS